MRGPPKARRRYFPRPQKRPLTRYLRRIASRGWVRASSFRAIDNAALASVRVTVPCPEVLSLVEATDPTVIFLNAITKPTRKTTKIFVDMRPVQRITPDGFLALLIAVKSSRCEVAGNLPLAQQPLDLMLRSGFQNHVKHRWERRQTQGLTERSGVMADGAEAARIVQFACNRLGVAPKLERNSYKVLVECMANTRNHASRKLRGGKRSAPERWYVHVYYDSQRRVACFCFADIGTGIIRSLRLDPSVRLRKTVASLVRGTGHTGVLREVLQGNIKSSTQFANRGLGLPKIASLAKAGYMKRLVIVANRAHLDCVNDTGSDTDQEFSGTLLYWEVGKVEL